jgi:hypothetical protein
VTTALIPFQVAALHVLAHCTYVVCVFLQAAQVVTLKVMAAECRKEIEQKDQLLEQYYEVAETQQQRLEVSS